MCQNQKILPIRSWWQNKNILYRHDQIGMKTYMEKFYQRHLHLKNMNIFQGGTSIPRFLKMNMALLLEKRLARIGIHFFHRQEVVAKKKVAEIRNRNGHGGEHKRTAVRTYP